MISIIILVKNEEENIIRVIKQFSWAEERIVVDNGSTDNTAINAKNNGAIVLSIPEMDFSRMRNEAAKKAKNDWILYIDTDEEIPPALKKEILSIVSSTPTQSQFKGYRILRKNYFFKHQWPLVDGMIRLIYKPSLIQWYGELHETAKINGKTSTLNNFLIHRTHNTLEDMLTQTNDWSDIEAALRFKTKHPAIVPWRLFRVLMTGFLQSYISQGSWKVGTLGLIESIYQGFSLCITYAKLWELQKYSKS